MGPALWAPVLIAAAPFALGVLKDKGNRIVWAVLLATVGALIAVAVLAS